MTTRAGTCPPSLLSTTNRFSSHTEHNSLYSYFENRQHKLQSAQPRWHSPTRPVDDTLSAGVEQTTVKCWWQSRCRPDTIVPYWLSQSLVRAQLQRRRSSRRHSSEVWSISLLARQSLSAASHCTHAWQPEAPLRRQTSADTLRLVNTWLETWSTDWTAVTGSWLAHNEELLPRLLQ